MVLREVYCCVGTFSLAPFAVDGKNDAYSVKMYEDPARHRIGPCCETKCAPRTTLSLPAAPSQLSPDLVRRAKEEGGRELKQ